MLDILGLVVRIEGLSDTNVYGINIGNFLTALIPSSSLRSCSTSPWWCRTTGSRDPQERDDPRRPRRPTIWLAEIRDLLRDRNTSV